MDERMKPALSSSADERTGHEQGGMTQLPAEEEVDSSARPSTSTTATPDASFYAAPPTNTRLDLGEAPSRKRKQPPSGPRKPEYVEVSDVEGTDTKQVEVPVQPVKVQPRRGVTTSSFVPRAPAPRPPPARASTSTTEFPSSAARSTAVRARRSTSPGPLMNISDAEDEKSVPSGWALPLSRETSPTEVMRRRRRNLPRGEIRGKGWIVSKLIAFEGEDGGRGGVWSERTYDVHVSDTPGEASKYRPMGSRVDLLDMAEGSSSSTSSEPMSPEQPRSSPSTTTTTAGDACFFTVSREELDNIKPHRHMYYCPKYQSWCLFAPLPKNRLLQGDDPYDTADPSVLRVETWRPDLAPAASPAAEVHKLGVPEPFVPADPSNVSAQTLLEYTDLEELLRPSSDHDLKNHPVIRSYGSHGGQAVYSRQDWYPPVIPAQLWNEWIQDKRDHPLPNEKAEATAQQAAQVIWKIIDNYLFKGENRSIPINGKGFSKHIRMDDRTREILVGILGFRMVPDSLILKPPRLWGRPEAVTLRARLLRCWLEIGLWLEAYRQLYDLPAIPTRVEMTPAGPRLAEAMGGDKLPRRSKGVDVWQTAGGNSKTPAQDPTAYESDNLGITPDVADEVAIGAYRENSRYAPNSRHEHLSALLSLANTRGSEAITLFIAKEKSDGAYTTEDLKAAYEGIGVGDHGMHLNDDIVGSAFVARWDEVKDPTRRLVLKQAFDLVIRSREDSDYLRAMLASVSDEKPAMDLPRASRLLDFDAAQVTDEDMVLMLFEIKMEDSPTNAEDLRSALATIGEHMKSEKIKVFLAGGTGTADAAGRPKDWPVGLANIAMTCYLNSLFQYLFTVRELREAVLSFTEQSGSVVYDPTHRIGGRLVSENEWSRSRRFVVLLRDLFVQLSATDAASVTPETELAYLALVPSKQELAAASALEDVKESSVAAPVEPGKSSEQAMAVEPEASTEMAVSPNGEKDEGSLDGDLIVVEKPTEGAGTEDVVMRPASPPVPPPLPPRPPRKKSTVAEFEKDLSSYMAFGRQNDVTECMDNVMFQIACALHPSGDSAQAVEDPGADMLRRTFYGATVQQLDIKDAQEDPLRTREEPFFSLIIDVAQEGRSVHDGLNKLFDDAAVEIEGKQARRRVFLRTTPALLQVQLSRVQYDHKKKRIFKSNAYLAFEREIQLDRYLEIDRNDPDAVERSARSLSLRHETERVQARADKLASHDSGDVSTAMRDLYHYTMDNLEELGDDVVELDAFSGSSAEVTALEIEVGSLETRLTKLHGELEDLWVGQQQASYELAAVFIHRGTAMSGHYYVYIRNSRDPSQWFKYNDTSVTEANAEQDIFRKTTGDTNPYFLVYCRKDKLSAFDTIARQ